MQIKEQGVSMSEEWFE